MTADKRDNERVLMAQVGAAHGIRGEVRVKPFGEDPLALGTFGPLESEDGSRRFEIVALRPQKAMLVVRFKGIDDRNAAEALNGTRLYVSRALLPAPEDDETFYLADLIGLAVVDPDGEPIGTVATVQNFGAGDLLEIAPLRGRSFYAPFTREVVPDIDLDAGRIVADLPEGLKPDAEADRAAAREEAAAMDADAAKPGDAQ